MSGALTGVFAFQVYKKEADIPAGKEEGLEKRETMANGIGHWNWLRQANLPQDSLAGLRGDSYWRLRKVTCASGQTEMCRPTSRHSIRSRRSADKSNDQQSPRHRQPHLNAQM